MINLKKSWRQKSESNEYNFWIILYYAFIDDIMQFLYC